jgi:acyl-CoA synthetase (AMP-forming)/AMP-acid ligase II
MGWIDEPSEERGVRFARGADGWEEWGWAELAAAANDAAAHIKELCGKRSGMAVAIVAPNGPEFIAAFYGALLAGQTPCPLAPANVIDDPSRYRDNLAALLAIAEPAALVTVAECSASLGESASGLPLLELEAQRAAAPFSPVRPAELALLQFTSGSSGRPRAVRVTRANLEANVLAIQQIVGIDPHADEVVTWLPTYHDLGLIGCTLTPAATGAPHERSTMTGTPPFGLGYAMKRVDDSQLEGLDFKRWRVAWLGAERIDAGLVARFHQRFAPFGMNASVFAPAYGLAEATLVVTAKQTDGVAQAVRPDWSALTHGGPVAIEQRASIAEHELIGDGAGWLVACGRAPGAIGVRVIGEDGRELPEGRVGEVLIEGECVTAGYLGDPQTTAERFRDGRLRSADAGFILDGELYVVGRIATALKVHGRWLFVEDVELIVHSSGIVERSRSVVFAGSQPRGEEIVVLVEREPGEWAHTLASRIAREIPDAIGLRIHSAPRGSIVRTSSGKPRRALLWAAHLSGALPGTSIVARAPGEGLPSGERA